MLHLLLDTLNMRVNIGLIVFYIMDKYIEELEKISNGYITKYKFVRCEYGRNHYDRMYKFAGLNEFYICSVQSEKSKIGIGSIFVSISGKGFSEQLGDELSYQIVYHAVKEHSANLTRLDICYDDYNMRIPHDKIISIFNNFINGKKLVHSRFRRDNAQIYYGVYDDVPYQNLVFGSRNSNQYMRLYDKRAEQGEKGYTVTEPYWYRFELELRHEAANSAFSEIMSSNYDLRHVWQLYLNRMFRILSREPRESEKGKHIDRIPTAKWWLKFVGTDSIGDVLKREYTVDYTIDKMLNHIQNVYGGYLYVLNTVAPKRLNSVLNSFQSEEMSFSPKYTAILNGFYDEEF